jgi:hypothetical protein
MKVTDEVLRKLVRDIGLIDFTELGAHEVVRQVSDVIGKSIITDIENIKDREVCFFSLGVAYAVAQEHYRTIPPINHKEKQSS